MIDCILCGKENAGPLCPECRMRSDLEDRCFDILSYDSFMGENDHWNSICGSLSDPRNFKNIVFAISDGLPEDRKQYIRLLCIAGNYEYVPAASRPWLYDCSKFLLDSPNLKEEEKFRIKGLLLSAFCADYDYDAAEEAALALMQADQLPVWCYYSLADYYTKTRRYSVADEVLQRAMQIEAGHEVCINKLLKLETANKEKENAPMNGKKEYLPNPVDAKKKYIAFLKKQGIEMEYFKMEKIEPIPIDQYPHLLETRDPNFSSFVAFDLETTGRNPRFDSIIEIGAVKVIEGNICEETEFSFQEFVKPYEKKISAEITQLTGISQDDVKNARDMWEVIPDFLDFAGDLPLVGYNSIKFDCKFLERAGRYSHREIENLNFDVLKYACKFKEKLGDLLNLTTVSTQLGIVNSHAHRALADALTTAKVFLKLKEMDSIPDKKESLDDFLSDLDAW